MEHFQLWLVAIKKKIKMVNSISKNSSKSIVYMGKSGNGQLTKMVNQICVASVIQ